MAAGDEGTTVRISRASAPDLPAILQVQRGAFGRLAESLGIDPAVMPPITESLEDLGALMESGTVFLKAHAGDRVLGTVRGTPQPDGSILIMRLAVAVSEQGNGLGTALMLELEETFTAATRFELYTGADVVHLVRLYERLGYRAFRTREVPAGGSSAARIVYMEKCRG